MKFKVVYVQTDLFLGTFYSGQVFIGLIQIFQKNLSKFCSLFIHVIVYK